MFSWRRLSWQQRVLRGAFVAGAALVVIYAALPCWLPTGVLKQWVANDMARQMGVKVTVDAMSFGWRDGVCIRGLTVAAPAGFGDEPMLTVEQIRTEFAPLRYLIAKRIEDMTIDRPELLVIVRQDGASNVAPLTKLQFNVDTRHIRVHEAGAILDLPGQDSPTQLDVASIRFDAGPRQRIGTVALSAQLQQEDGAAPISLRVEPGHDPSVATRATFSFSDVDLTKLALQALLDLPVSKFGGLCSGSVELRLDRKFVVDQFSVRLSAVNLDVQPTSGPKLPVFERADLDATARYDPLAPDGRLEIQSVRIHLPDTLELKGQAVVFTGLGASWQAVESIQLSGRASPSQLTQILTGRGGLGESDVTITGPVDLDISASRSPTDLSIGVGIDATDATVERTGQVLKPAGRAFACELAGRFNERSDTFDVQDGSYLVLGANRVGGSGRICSARQMVKLIQSREAPGQVWEIVDSIAAVDWNGEVTLADRQAVVDFLPELTSALAEVTLDGSVTAKWSGFERAGRRLELHVTVPTETRLTIGDWFAKPPGEPLTLAFASAIDAAEGRLDDIDIDFTCGAGRFGVDNSWAKLARNDAGPAGPVELAGNFTAEQFQAIAACLPLLAERTASTRTQFQGRYHATYDPSTGFAEAEAVISQLQIAWGADAGDLDRDPTRPGGKVSGDISIYARSIEDGGLTISLTGDDLEARAVTGDISRIKRAASPLRGRATFPADRAGAITMSLTFGGSEVTISEPSGQAGETVSARYEATLTADDVLLAMLPELAETVDAVDLRGKLKLAGEFSYSADGAAMTANVDAGDMAFQLAEGLVKPRGATMEAFLRVSSDVESWVAIGIERGLLGQVGITGEVDIRRQLGPDGGPGDATSSGLLLLTTEHGESIGQFAPSMTDNLIAASGQAELQWGGNATSTDIDVKAGLAEVIFRHNDKDIHLTGDLVATLAVESGSDAHGDHPATDEEGERGVAVKSIVTDGLEFRIEESHGFIVADLADLSHGATGSMHVLADKLDTKALVDWLAGEEAQRITTKLTEEEEAALDAQALAAIEAIRPVLLNSKVQLHVSVDELRMYDEAVEQFYDFKSFSGQATVDYGYVSLEIAAGLNSGTLRRRFQTHLADEAPVVRYEAELVDVIATENIRPQIALSFPGNTVTGFFNKEDDLQMLLQAVIANSVDWRYPLRPTGEAKTIAIEGITEGQAAPKFITRLFPGLNTAQYEYKKMTAFADYAEDGLVINDMVFDGEKYDLYMDGTTDTENIGRYEIGVILLSQPQSAEWNHKYRQGRLPILKFEGRIENGKLHDVVVNYPWPNETLYIVFMKNNYLYRVWLEQKRRPETK